MAEKQHKPRRKKFRTMAISVFIAVIVWFAVIYVNDPDITTTISDLNLRIVGETMLRDKQLAVTGRNEIPPLSVVVTGKRSDLINFMDDIYVQVDVSDINSTGDYKLSGTISLPTTRITVEKENYSEIPLKVEKLESREIEVTLKQTGTLKNKLVKSQITNPKVTITGAESEIKNVYGASATMDISNISGDGTERVSYLLTDEAGELISTNETLESTHSFIEVSNEIYEAKTLNVEPVLTAELAKEYILKSDKTVVSPSAVTVGVMSGHSAEKVIARIDKLEDSGEGDYRLEASNGMYIPPEVQQVKVKTDTVRKSTEELELNVEARNVSEGLSVSISGPIRAGVWGEEGKVNNENIKAFVDVSGLGAGEYTLPVHIAGDNAGFDGEYKAEVKIE